MWQLLIWKLDGAYEQWFPTRVARHTRVSQRGARGAASYYISMNFWPISAYRCTTRQKRVENIALEKGSQTRGPQEGSMRPPNIKKNSDFQGNIQWHLAYFLNLASKIKNIFFNTARETLLNSLIRPRSQFEFETPALASLFNSWFHSWHVVGSNLS